MGSPREDSERPKNDAFKVLIGVSCAIIPFRNAKIARCQTEFLTVPH